MMDVWLRLDKIRNGYIRGSLGVVGVAGKMRENRMKCYGLSRRNDVR